MCTSRRIKSRSLGFAGRCEPSVGSESRSCGQMFFQKFERPLARELRSFGVIAGAVAGVEAVACTFVPIDGQVGMDGGNLGVDEVLRYMVVLHSEVEHDGRFEFFRRIGWDLAA